MLSRFSLTFILVLGLMPSLDPALAGSETHAAPIPVPAPTTAAPSPIVSPAYVIKTGDSLYIVLYGEDDLTRWVKVVPACYVVLPLIGQVQVLGLTIAAEAKIAAVYGKDVLINPSVTIEVLPAL